MAAGREPGRKLRVVTLVDGLGLVGGGERLAREIAIRLNPGRFESTLCVSRWTARHAQDPAAQRAIGELERAGVRFVGMRRDRPYDLAAWGRLVSLLRRERVDILHAHKFGSNVWAAALRPITRTPVVIAHEHTWSFEGRPVRRFLDRNLVARGADLILTVSTEDRRRMIEIERIDPARLRFVPNGIPAPGPPTGRDVRAELGIPPEAPVVGTVGALRPQKAMGVLIRAAARLRETIGGLRVLIVGDGEARASLELLIGDLGLSGVVTLMGRRTDVPDVLEALDVAVCCSDFEGTPLSILEYMEAARPVVATRVGGVPDLIDDGVHGFLVPPRDPEALAGALGALLRDPGLRATMGERGRARRRTEFDITRTVAEVERLYERLAAAGEGRADRLPERDEARARPASSSQRDDRA